MTGQRDGRFSLKEKKIPQLHLMCSAVLFFVTDSVVAPIS